MQSVYCQCSLTKDQRSEVNKIKNKKYHTVGTVLFPKSNRKILETEVKSIPLTHTFLAWHRHFNKKWWG
jgi:hypothetical protein